MSKAIIDEIKRQFVGERCWLEIDGKEYESKVTGRHNDLASVSPLDADIPSVKFSWHTVNRIMRKGKLFVS